MAGKKRTWMCGVAVDAVSGTLRVWTLDGIGWQYSTDDGKLMMRRDGKEAQVVGSFECVRLAVGFSIGAHEGLGMAKRSRLMEVIAF